MASRRRLTKEFKQEAVRFVLEQRVAMSQVARDLDLHVTMLRQWVRAQHADPTHAFPGEGQQKPEQAELTRLRREVATLRMERDILQKRPRTSPRSRCEIRRCGDAPSDVAGRDLV